MGLHVNRWLRHLPSPFASFRLLLRCPGWLLHLRLVCRRSVRVCRCIVRVCASFLTTAHPLPRALLRRPVRFSEAWRSPPVTRCPGWLSRIPLWRECLPPLLRSSVFRRTPPVTRITRCAGVIVKAFSVPGPSANGRWMGIHPPSSTNSSPSRTLICTKNIYIMYMYIEVLQIVFCCRYYNPNYI
jgi:hypothetical protein